MKVLTDPCALLSAVLVPGVNLRVPGVKSSMRRAWKRSPLTLKDHMVFVIHST